MKTDAQMLQDVMAELQRGLAAQAGHGCGKRPPVEIRVTLSGAVYGDGADVDIPDPAVSILHWTRSPVAGAGAEPPAAPISSTELAGAA